MTYARAVLLEKKTSRKEKNNFLRKEILIPYLLGILLSVLQVNK